MARRSRKRKFTAAQKKAYYRGQGYRAGANCKRIPYIHPQRKKAFRDGYRSVGSTVVLLPDRDC